MSQKENDLDINEAFTDLLFTEEIAQKTGYQEGYVCSKDQLLKSYHLGFHKGSTIATQLGYYCGVLEQYLSNNDNNEKAIKIAKKLIKDIFQTFPNETFHDDNFDILETFNDIKFKYAKFCSLAKINPVYPEANKLDF